MDRVEVELARVVDRDRLLAALAERRIDAKAVDEPGGRLAIEVPCDDGDQGRVCDELLAELESWVTADGIPLVPLRTHDSIVLRPPGD